MKITKRNGNITVYDDEKITQSILKANAEIPGEAIPEAVAANIAECVFSRLTEENDIITTADVRKGVEALLIERGLPETAKAYSEYKK